MPLRHISADIIFFKLNHIAYRFDPSLSVLLSRIMLFYFSVFSICSLLLANKYQTYDQTTMPHSRQLIDKTSKKRVAREEHAPRWILIIGTNY